MKVLKLLGLALAGAVLTLLFTGIFLPTHYQVSRSVVIDAPATAAWPQVGDLRRHAAWSPWKAADPSMTVSCTGDGATDGSACAWTSEQSGSGTITFVRAEAPRRLDTKVAFDGAGTTSSTFTLDPDGTGTRITWTVEGDVTTPVVAGWLASAADGDLGPQLEDGLRRLAARVAEGEQGTSAAGATPSAVAR